MSDIFGQPQAQPAQPDPAEVSALLTGVDPRQVNVMSGLFSKVASLPTDTQEQRRLRDILMMNLGRFAEQMAPGKEYVAIGMMSTSWTLHDYGVPLELVMSGLDPEMVQEFMALGEAVLQKQQERIKGDSPEANTIRNLAKAANLLHENATKQPQEKTGTDIFGAQDSQS